MSDITAKEYVKLMNLLPHPEGGYYREIYRSRGKFESEGEFPNGRSFATSIYFMIEHGNFSAFHRIRSDETWHFYSGDPLEVIEITTDGTLKTTLIGNDLLKGEVFQYTVPAGSWFASRVFGDGKFSLVGCTVSPGFDFRDFEMGGRDNLIFNFAKHKKIIQELTRF